MSTFSFRFRVDVAPGCTISSDAVVLPLFETPTGQCVELVGEQGISKSTRLVLRAHGWPSTSEAEEAGSHMADAFVLALVRHRVGAEFWPRRASGVFHPAGLQMLEERTGSRVLNDRLGLMVYETDPAPRFASTNVVAVRGASAEEFVETFRRLASSCPRLTDRERVSIDLFIASFFEPAADTRLLMLVMAVEALLEFAPRSAEAVALVDGFITAVQSSCLPEPEQASLKGALEWLRQDSIRGAGRKLAAKLLGDKMYDGRPAPKFSYTVMTSAASWSTEATLGERVSRLAQRRVNWNCSYPICFRLGLPVDGAMHGRQDVA